MNSIALVKPEKSKAIEQLLIRMAQSGQLPGKVGYTLYQSMGHCLAMFAAILGYLITAWRGRLEKVTRTSQ